jgi:hypothetical protein
MFGLEKFFKKGKDATVAVAGVAAVVGGISEAQAGNPSADKKENVVEYSADKKSAMFSSLVKALENKKEISTASITGDEYTLKKATTGFDLIVKEGKVSKKITLDAKGNPTFITIDYGDGVVLDPTPVILENDLLKRNDGSQTIANSKTSNAFAVNSTVLSAFDALSGNSGVEMASNK